MLNRLRRAGLRRSMLCIALSLVAFSSQTMASALGWCFHDDSGVHLASAYGLCDHAAERAAAAHHDCDGAAESGHAASHQSLMDHASANSSAASAATLMPSPPVGVVTRVPADWVSFSAAAVGVSYQRQRHRLLEPLSAALRISGARPGSDSRLLI